MLNEIKNEFEKVREKDIKTKISVKNLIKDLKNELTELENELEGSQNEMTVYKKFIIIKILLFPNFI